MTELDLYQFLKENEIDMRWDDGVLSTWLSYNVIDEFTTLISSFLYNEGIDATLLSHGVLWIDLVPACEYFDIDPKRIFPI